MQVKILYDHATEIRDAISHASSLQFFLEDWIKDERRKLEKESDEKEFFRQQGRIEVLDRLVGLKKELDQYLEKKTTSGLPRTA